MNENRKEHRLYDEEGRETRDSPWIFRTYAGHTSVRASNELFRSNLSRGQTGLSIAFDLPTQCGYSSDHPIARSEVGKVGVPVNSLDDMHALFADLPLSRMNTSMTINATAPWLFALYIALARERGENIRELRGTVQNDIIKEYLARGTYIFPPEPSLRLTAEIYEYCLENVPLWNPSNICSYHLQEAGATPIQELSFSLASALDLLGLLRERGRISPDDFERAVGRVSFFVNAGTRFIEETCKVRAFTELWDELLQEIHGIDNPRYRRFRYGVQVNSLGLTEQQPSNNAWRIFASVLGVTLGRNARCRALQLPAWNEAISLPRPWDQLWSLRLQQILALETDLLEYPDIFEGSIVIESRTRELKEEARKELERIQSLGGVRIAAESGYLKSELVRSMTRRNSRINTGEQKLVGVNVHTSALDSPLLAGEDGGIFHADPEQTGETLALLQATREKRDPDRVRRALARLREAALDDSNLMEPSIECALARVTTGEWADELRAVFGEYRAPTGAENQTLFLPEEDIARAREKTRIFLEREGRRPRLLVGKPGLDGHSNGAEMIAVAARHAGWDVIYSGIRLATTEIVRNALEENADMIGLSILSGSHLELAGEILDLLRENGAFDEIPLVLGGIIPDSDVPRLLEMGVRRVFHPRDYQLSLVMENLLDILLEESP